jgi:hypothetical protein
VLELGLPHQPLPGALLQVINAFHSTQTYSLFRLALLLEDVVQSFTVRILIAQVILITSTMQMVIIALALEGMSSKALSS